MANKFTEFGQDVEFIKADDYDRIAQYIFTTNDIISNNTGHGKKLEEQNALHVSVATPLRELNDMFRDYKFNLGLTDVERQFVLNMLMSSKFNGTKASFALEVYDFFEKKSEFTYDDNIRIYYIINDFEVPFNELPIFVALHKKVAMLSKLYQHIDNEIKEVSNRYTKWLIGFGDSIDHREVFRLDQ